MVVIVLIYIVSTYCTKKNNNIEQLANLTSDKVNTIKLLKEGSRQEYLITDITLITDIINIIKKIELEEVLYEDTKGYIYSIVIKGDDTYIKIVLNKKMTKINSTYYHSDNFIILTELNNILSKVVIDKNN
jgi:hypothetical protein